ncbi:MAG: HlyD family type I secretion periplasmic adaptor subunit [Sedimenticola sp.]
MESAQQIAPVDVDRQPYVRIGFFMLLLTFVVFFGWAAIAPLNSAVVAGGRIIVASENKTVQHLDGGLVKSIAVKEGDLIKAGQLLLTLDGEPLRIHMYQIQSQLLDTRANLERLMAERDGRNELTFSSELLSIKATTLGHEILGTQQQLFLSRRAVLASERDIFEQRLRQTQKQLDGGTSLLETQRHRLTLLRQERDALLKLFGNKVVSEAKVREIEGSVAALRGDIVVQEGEQARLSELYTETGFSALLRDQEYRKEVLSQLRDLQSQQINLQAEERDLLDKLTRIEIHAPVSGKIKGFKVVTIGAVISAGQSIMEIVPLEQDFKINARISLMDIDSLHPGLSAEVRFPVFDGSQRYPGLFAAMVDVSTDIYQDEGSKESYYKASLVMEKESLAVLAAEDLKLVSGMPVDVIIKTGERTLVDYLLRPLSDMLARAFNET